MQREARNRVGTVFYVSVALSILFVVWGVLFTDSLADFNAAALSFVTETFGWVYLIATSLFIVFMLFLAISRFGRIRLGKDGDRPEFSTASWLAMLFSAGMGIGLVFYGIAEPMSHLATPPLDMAEPGSMEAGRLAMQYTFFHWGLHPWAIYGLVALSLAYFQFRKGRSGLISAAFYPILGDWVEGPIGKAIDVLAIFVTTLGVATSFGIGALQINSGANYLFGIPDATAVQVLIIAVVTALFVASAVSGLNRGIRYLSNFNMTLMGGLMLFVLILGPTLFIFDTFTATLGNYIQNFVTMSFTSGAFTQDDAWLQGWTIFYWTWWMTWVMWVGTFVARISRGRTIREFVVGVLLVPSLLSFLWFSVLGGAALHLDLFQDGNIASAVGENIATALFVTLDEFPLGFVMSLVAITLIGSFFITSADSASWVLGSLSTGGSQNPTAAVKVVWGAFIAAFAVVLLLAGGLEAVQQVAIISGVPFTILLIGLAVALYKAVSAEVLPERPAAPVTIQDGSSVTGGTEHSDKVAPGH